MKPTEYRCRKCQAEFTLKATPKVAALIQCRKCKSTDVEIMNP